MDTVKAQQLYDSLHSNIVKLVFARNKHDEDTVRACQELQENIMRSVYDSEEDVQDCFFALLIAEFKEAIYWNTHDARFCLVDYNIIMEFDKMFDADAELYDMLYYHEHDPNHRMFRDVQNYYHFYEMVESQGGYVLDMWDSTDDNKEIDAKADFFNLLRAIDESPFNYTSDINKPLMIEFIEQNDIVLQGSKIIWEASHIRYGDYCIVVYDASGNTIANISETDIIDVNGKILEIVSIDANDDYGSDDSDDSDDSDRLEVAVKDIDTYEKLVYEAEDFMNLFELDTTTYMFNYVRSRKNAL